jgi:hypothetical protein
MHSHIDVDVSSDCGVLRNWIEPKRRLSKTTSIIIRTFVHTNELQINLQTVPTEHMNMWTHGVIGAMKDAHTRMESHTDSFIICNSNMTCVPV